MPAVIRSDLAEIDLLEIWLHIAHRNVGAANRFLDKLGEEMQRLARFPGLGQQRDDLKVGLRSWPVGNYLIFYSSAQQALYVYRVLHGARDVQSEFRG